MSSVITDKEARKEDLRNLKFDRIPCNMLEVLSDMLIQLEDIEARLQALEAK
jgi:hypothetical protein